MPPVFGRVHRFHEGEEDLMMKRLPQFRNGVENRATSLFAITCLVTFAVHLQIADYAQAHIDFAVDCSDGFPCELIPILNPNQVLLTVPIPDVFPDNPCLTCPPFVEFFDIAGLDTGEVEPPPPFEARVRLFGGDPSPQPNITDSPNLPNLLLIFAGPNDLAGPMEFAPFSIPLPPGTTQLPFQAQAFDAQRNFVSNFGIIRIPEPSSMLQMVVPAIAGLLGVRIPWKQ